VKELVIIKKHTKFYEKFSFITCQFFDALNAVLNNYLKGNKSLDIHIDAFTLCISSHPKGLQEIFLC